MSNNEPKMECNNENNKELLQEIKKSTYALFDFIDDSIMKDSALDLTDSYRDLGTSSFLAHSSESGDYWDINIAESSKNFCTLTRLTSNSDGFTYSALRHIKLNKKYPHAELNSMIKYQDDTIDVTQNILDDPEDVKSVLSFIIEDSRDGSKHVNSNYSIIFGQEAQKIRRKHCINATKEFDYICDCQPACNNSGGVISKIARLLIAR